MKAVDTDKDVGTGAVYQRLQNRNRRRKPEPDEDPSRNNEDGSSQRRPAKKRSGESSGPGEQYASGGSCNVRSSSLQYAATNSAGGRFSPLTITPSYVAAREFHDLKNETGPGRLHSEATADLFRPSGGADYGDMAGMQNNLRGSQEPPALNQLPPELLLHKLKQLQDEHQQLQEQQQRLQEEEERQYMQQGLASCSGNVASYGNSFSQLTNGSNTMMANAGPHGGPLSSVSSATATSPEGMLQSPGRNGDNVTLDSPLLSLLFQSRLNQTAEGSWQGFPEPASTPGNQHASLPAITAVAGPPIVAGQDWPRTVTTFPSTTSQQAPYTPQSDEPPTELEESRFPDRNQMVSRGEALLYQPCDKKILSDYQLLLRQQIEFFIAEQEDINYFTPNRRKELSVGQVGIRCRHCATLRPKERPRGAVYFPFGLKAIYQAAQNMVTDHFADQCAQIDSQMKELLLDLQGKRGSSGVGGKIYWAEAAVRRGLIETETGLRFCGR